MTAPTRAFQKLARSSFMQLLGQVSAPIIAGIAILLLNEVWSMTKGFVKMESNIAALTAIVTATNVDRYTGTQAANDKAFLQSQITDLKVRQDAVEQRPRVTVRALVAKPK